MHTSKSVSCASALSQTKQNSFKATTVQVSELFTNTRYNARRAHRDRAADGCRLPSQAQRPQQRPMAQAVPPSAPGEAADPALLGLPSGSSLAAGLPEPGPQGKAAGRTRPHRPGVWELAATRDQRPDRPPLAPDSRTGRRMMKLRGGFQQQPAAGVEPAPAGAAFFITGRGEDGISPCAGGQDGVRHAGGRAAASGPRGCAGAGPGGRVPPGWWARPSRAGWPLRRAARRTRPAAAPPGALPACGAPACKRGRGGPGACCSRRGKGRPCGGEPGGRPARRERVAGWLRSPVRRAPE